MEPKYNLYYLYTDNKYFVGKLKKYLNENFDMTPSKYWNKGINQQNKDEFIKLYDLVNMRIKYYNNILDGYYKKGYISDKGPEMSNKTNINKLNSNKNIKSNVKNASNEDKIMLLINIFFEDKNNKNNKSNKKKPQWLKYWQLFALLLQILNNEIDIDILFDLLKKKDINYQLYTNILDTCRKNYKIVRDKYSNELKKCSNNSKLDTCDSFFKYLRAEYCIKDKRKNISQTYSDKCGEVHELDNNKKNIIINECKQYEGNKNTYPKCVKNVLCDFIVYCTSNEELKKSKSIDIIKKNIEYIILYYTILSYQYYKILEYMRNIGYEQGGEILNQNDYNVLSKFTQAYSYVDEYE